jgi:integrase
VATVRQAWAALVARTDLPRIPLHGVRHAFETALHEQGMPVHVIAAIMGDDPAVSLRTYAHAHDRAMHAATAVETLLTGTRPALRVVDAPDEGARDHTVITDAHASNIGGT